MSDSAQPSGCRRARRPASARQVLVILAACLSVARADAAWRLEGSAGLETRWFPKAPLYPEQARHAAVLLLNPVLKIEPAADGPWRATLDVAARIDARDRAARTVDLSQATVMHQTAAAVWRAGFDKVFWGVTESVHLIDVVNQVDPRVSIDLDAKLGQPMLSYSRFLGDAGRVDALWLPYFRERPSPGEASRQRVPGMGTVQTDHGLGSLRRTDDVALRWAGALPWGGADAGLYHFAGLGREPIPGPLGPSYRRMRQTGLQLQLPRGNMLWKLEALHREGHGQPFWAYVSGGEYTMSFDAGDLGLLAEWSRDHRDASAPPTRFARSGFAGLRFRLSDSSDTEVKVGVLRDTVVGATLYKAEFGRRLAEHYGVSLVARKLRVGGGAATPYAPLAQDDNLQLTLRRSF